MGKQPPQGLRTKLLYLIKYLIAWLTQAVTVELTLPTYPGLVNFQESFYT